MNTVLFSNQERLSNKKKIYLLNGSVISSEIELIKLKSNGIQQAQSKTVNHSAYKYYLMYIT